MCGCVDEEKKSAVEADRGGLYPVFGLGTAGGNGIDARYPLSNSLSPAKKTTTYVVYRSRVIVM